MLTARDRRSAIQRARWRAFIAGIALLVAGPASGAQKAIEWKAAADALLRVNDRPVNDWNVYQPGKKNDPLLLKMGGRFLLIDVHDRRIFEIAPAKIAHKGPELLFDPNDRPSEPLATSDWIVKDVGLAYRFSAKLTTEMSLVDVQIPHPLDLRNIH